jgi:SAGA-associated factor 29
VELQRVVHTIKDIDERQSALRDETRKRVEQCLAMPSASSRQASADDVDATNAARKEIERAHADINQLSLEKVRLARIALEMIQYNIRDLDAELGPFTEEMKQRNEAGFDDEFAVDGVDGVDPTGFGDFDHPGPADHRPKKSHKKKQPAAPQPGERVAANIGEITTGPGAQEWIVAVVVQYLPQELAYEVMDADDDAAAEGNGQTYRLPQDLVIAMPRSATSRDGVNFPQGTTVLAVYPNTTTFYRAVVVQQAKKVGNGEYGEFLLEFDTRDASSFLFLKRPQTPSKRGFRNLVENVFRSRCFMIDP